MPDEELARRLVAGPVVTNPVARTLAMLVNEAVDLVARGEASAEDVDTAMRLGTNYPRGPLEWGAEIGLDVVAAQLAELDAAFPGGRYRPSPRPGPGRHPDRPTAPADHRRRRDGTDGRGLTPRATDVGRRPGLGRARHGAGAPRPRPGTRCG